MEETDFLPDDFLVMPRTERCLSETMNAEYAWDGHRDLQKPEIKVCDKTGIE